MAEYFKIVNVTKKELLHPHHYDTGMKMGEFQSSKRFMDRLATLTAPSGSWHGDQVLTVGEYTQDPVLLELYETATPV